MAAYEVLLLNTAIPQIQAAQSGDTYVVPRDIAFNAGVNVINNDVTIYGVTVGRGAGAVVSNTAVGASALSGNTSGTRMTAVGYRAMVATTGNFNAAFGSNAFESLVAGTNGTAIGDFALQQTTGSYNTAIGNGSGYLISTGSKNTIVGIFNGNQGGLDIRTASNHIVLSDGDGNPRLYSDGSGNINITAGNLVMSTSGKGIDFSATSSGTGTMTSELLADYEEGTWTPVLKFGTNTQTINIQAATYVKVGRAVTINMSVSWAAKSGSGRVYIMGLPFAKENNATVGLLASCSAGSITTTAALFYNVDANGTDLNLAEQSADIDSASLASSGQIACTGTYFV